MRDDRELFQRCGPLLDERLKQMLVATNVRVWESAPSPFWDFGYPSNAGPDLIADLRAEGLFAEQ